MTWPTHPHRWMRVGGGLNGGPPNDWYCPRCRRYSPVNHGGNCPAPDPELVEMPSVRYPDNVGIKSEGLDQKLEDLINQ